VVEGGVENLKEVVKVIKINQLHTKNNTNMLSESQDKPLMARS